MRVLVLDQDDPLGKGVRRRLLQSGYAADCVASDKDAIGALATHEYSVFLLDLHGPDTMAMSLLAALRHKRSRPGVIVITACASARERISLLDSGADDCIARPLDLDELTARVRAVLRRRELWANEAAPRQDPLVLIVSRRSATWKGEHVQLTSKEFWLLESFVRRRNEILSRAQLEEALYSWGAEVESNAVEVHIHHLRRKFAPNLIETIRGVGYQLGSSFVARLSALAGFLVTLEHSLEHLMML